MTLGTVFPPKPRPCKACGKPFQPFNSLQQICATARCAAKFVKLAKVEERAKVRTKREQMKRIPELIAEADKAFAEFIRLRDQLAGHPCISSGKPLDWVSGNQVDAGHYLSRGARSHLRYREDNCHAQSKKENRFLAGNVVEYRIRLIERIGLARVEALEADKSVHKWTADELRAIRDTYRAKVKQMKKEQA